MPYQQHRSAHFSVLDGRIASFKVTLTMIPVSSWFSITRDYSKKKQHADEKGSPCDLEINELYGDQEDERQGRTVDNESQGN